MKAAFDRLRWLAAHNPGALPLLAAAVLLVSALAMHRLVLVPIEDRIAALEDQRAARRHASFGRMESEFGGAGDPRARLAGFYRFFAGGESITGLLARLQAVARDNGIDLVRADYQLQVEPGQKLDRYQITVPLRAPYPVVRRFVAAALAEIPTMALDQLQLQRRTVGDNAAEAQLRFTFYLAK